MKYEDGTGRFFKQNGSFDGSMFLHWQVAITHYQMKQIYYYRIGYDRGPSPHEMGSFNALAALPVALIISCNSYI